MSGGRIVAWLLFLVWAVWACALQGHLARGGSAWVPDIALVLALSLMARAEAADTPFIALCAAIARAAFGPEPPIVLLAGYMAIVFLALLVRTAVELGGPLWRTLFALVFVLGLNVWFGTARAMRDPTGGVHTSVLFAALPTAIATALLAFAAGPLFAYLPGLTPIRRRRW